MSTRSLVAGSIRALLIAAATGAAAFGALVIFQPFSKAPPPAAITIMGSPAAEALQVKIEAVRLSLRETETALGSANSPSVVSGPSSDAAVRAQYEVQIAAATERRDLALRHASAIRQALDAGVTPASLAEIRDSVVIGQLLTQQAALEAQIGLESARFRPNHPTMLALNAQRTALVTQIRREAASIATALESEAKIDNSQIELLQGQLPADVSPTVRPDTSALEAQAASQRAELDGLVDAYFNIPPATASTQQPSRPADPLSALNLLVVGTAATAAIIFQVLLSIRRRRAALAVRSDIAAWETDRDADVKATDEITVVDELERKVA